jgi:hypothetical protein
MADRLKPKDDEMGRRLSEVAPSIKKLKDGEAHSFPSAEGPVTITRQARVRGVDTFRVEGGGHNVDPDVVRGDRHVLGHRGAAREVAERLHNSGYADAAHSLEMEAAVAQAHQDDKSFHVKTSDGHKASISRNKDGSVHVQYGGKLKDSNHPDVRTAVASMKDAVRADGGHFLEVDGSKDPLSERGPEQLTSAQVKQMLHDKEKADAVGERVEQISPSSAPPATPLEYLKDKAYDKLNDVTSGGSASHAKEVGRVGKGLASPGTAENAMQHITPDHLRVMADAVTQAHAHASMAAMTLAPHVAMLAPHVSRLVAAAEIAAVDLEEAAGSSELLRARARATATARLLEAWSDEARAASAAERRLHTRTGVGGDRLRIGDKVKATRSHSTPQPGRVLAGNTMTIMGNLKGVITARDDATGQHHVYAMPQVEKYLKPMTEVNNFKRDEMRLDPDENGMNDLDESPQTAALSVTPSPFSASKTSNWVARGGGLPSYIQHIAKAIVRGGKSESEAISIAIGTCKRWAAGGGGVSPEVKAAAAKAIAQWEALKAKNAGKEAAKKAA